MLISSETVSIHTNYELYYITTATKAKFRKLHKQMQYKPTEMRNYKL